jgi:hypothetical protein
MLFVSRDEREVDDATDRSRHRAVLVLCFSVQAWVNDARLNAANEERARRLHATMEATHAAAPTTQPSTQPVTLEELM